MAWLVLAESDISNVLAKPEMDLFNAALGPPGVTDRLATILVQVTSLVRGKVAAWPENLNKMGPGASPAVGSTPAVLGTIPEELWSDAIEIARYKVLTSIPSAANSFITEARMEGYRSANKHLDDAANGKLVIEPVPSSTETGAAFDTAKIAYGSKGHRENWDFFGGGGRHHECND
jgi:hypothetical protein